MFISDDGLSIIGNNRPTNRILETVCMGKAYMRGDTKPADQVAKGGARMKSSSKAGLEASSTQRHRGGVSSLKSVRASNLKRARQLLEDANYPSDEVIESVADLLARSWQHDKKMRAGSGG